MFADELRVVEPLPATEPADEEEEEDRHNFALARDGAKLVAANKEAKKAAAVLDSDSDTFCKNECKAEKWFIMELSQVAKVDTVELSQVWRLAQGHSLHLLLLTLVALVECPCHSIAAVVVHCSDLTLCPASCCAVRAVLLQNQ